MKKNSSRKYGSDGKLKKNIVSQYEAYNSIGNLGGVKATSMRNRGKAKPRPRRKGRPIWSANPDEEAKTAREEPDRVDELNASFGSLKKVADVAPQTEELDLPPPPPRPSEMSLRSMNDLSYSKISARPLSDDELSVPPPPALSRPHSIQSTATDDLIEEQLRVIASRESATEPVRNSRIEMIPSESASSEQKKYKVIRATHASGRSASLASIKSRERRTTRRTILPPRSGSRASASSRSGKNERSASKLGAKKPSSRSATSSNPKSIHEKKSNFGEVDLPQNKEEDDSAFAFISGENLGSSEKRSPSRNQDFGYYAPQRNPLAKAKGLHKKKRNG